MCFQCHLCNLVKRVILVITIVCRFISSSFSNLQQEKIVHVFQKENHRRYKQESLKSQVVTNRKLLLRFSLFFQISFAVIAKKALAQITISRFTKHFTANRIRIGKFISVVIAITGHRVEAMSKIIRSMFIQKLRKRKFSCVQKRCIKRCLTFTCESLCTFFFQNILNFKLIF